jgi:putative transposase
MVDLLPVKGAGQTPTFAVAFGPCAPGRMGHSDESVHRRADRDGTPPARGRDAGRRYPPASAAGQLGISDTAPFRWQKKFGSLGVSELRELRQLREENRKLRALVADLTLDRHMLQEIVRR